MDKTSDLIFTRSDLALFNILRSPIWIFDIEQMKMWWANPAALSLWNAGSLEELLNRDWSDFSEGTKTRLQGYLQEFKQEKTVIEQWTFYPKGRALSVRCVCSGIRIEGGYLAMLIEGVADVVEPVDSDTLRSIEALRHTTLMVSLYTFDEVPLMQNPSALRCYGDEKNVPQTDNKAFRRRFVDASVAEQAISCIATGDVFSIETQVNTLNGIRWHKIDVRRTNDPSTGVLMILVNEKDITDLQQMKLELRQRDRLLEGVAKATNQLLTIGDRNLGISRALEVLGRATAVDRVYIVQNHVHPVRREHLMSKRWEWISQTSVQLKKPKLQNLSYQAILPSWYKNLAMGKPIIGLVRNFPSPEREFLESQDIRSILVVPLRIEGQCWGFIGFDDCHKEHQWSESETSILMGVAGSISGAIAHSSAVAKLVRLNADLEAIIEERTAELKVANEQLRQEISVSETAVKHRQHIEKRLRHNAFHDALTGLPNRALLMENLGRALERTKQHPDYLFAVLFLDLDRFKVVNDSMGHTIGDRLLIALAQRLQHCLQEDNSLIARLGGDEFAILLEDIQELSDANRIAEQIHKQLTHPFLLDGQEIFTSVSIGIALSSTGYNRPEELLRDADIVLYRAKAQGRSRYEVFDLATHERIVALLKLEQDLQRAVQDLEAGQMAIWELNLIPQFQLYYQPIVNLKTGQLVGFEALVRWQPIEQEFISPGEFIPIAEETDLIVPLGAWVLRQACLQLRTWQKQFPHALPLSVSVNLSGRQFSQSDLVTQIDQILQETNLDGRALKLEITETVIMANPELAAAMLLQLKRRNIQLCIDDFGTGYSSLSYLHRFPLDTLKIDQSFVRQMGVEAEHSEIIKTIVALAHNLGMEVIAEGIETQTQLEKLQGFNCELGQGYLFSKPVDSRIATQFIAQDWQLSHLGMGSGE